MVTLPTAHTGTDTTSLMVRATFLNSPNGAGVGGQCRTLGSRRLLLPIITLT